MDARKVLCEIVCLKCVEALRDDRYEQHVHAREFAGVRQLRVLLRHITREANGPADCLAEMGATSQCAHYS